MMLHRMRHSVVWLAAVAIVFAVPAFTQDDRPTPADQQFVKWAIETDNAEIGAARLALQQSSANDVLQFAHRMIRDHMMLNEQMKELAGRIGISVAPGQVTYKQQELADKLMPLRGSAFNQLYIPAMVKGHRRALKKIRQEIAGTHYLPAEKGAQEAQPILQQHLQLAEKMAQDHNIKVPATGHKAKNK